MASSRMVRFILCMNWREFASIEALVLFHQTILDSGKSHPVTAMLRLAVRSNWTVYDAAFIFLESASRDGGISRTILVQVFVEIESMNGR